MMDPELIKLAQEQMSLMPPNDLARIQQQGNELYNQGMYTDALQKYMLAKKNLKDTPFSQGRTILSACSLDMMSCYLKTRQYHECIKEGTEVLADDVNNVKALYRRGQAYKELGLLEDVVFDFSRAYEVSPDDENIADVFRDAKERFERVGGGSTSRRGLVIEEIPEEEKTVLSENYGRSTGEYSLSQDAQPQETSCSANDQADINTEPPSATNSLYFQTLKDSQEVLRSFQKFMSDTHPQTLAAISALGDGESPDMTKTASNMISSMSPEELRRMLQLDASFYGENSNLKRDCTNSDSNSFRPPPPDEIVDMIKMANDIKIHAEELQKMLQSSSSDPIEYGSDNASKPAETSEKLVVRRDDAGESSSAHGFSYSRTTPQSSFANPAADLEEQMRNQMNDPAMQRQMFTSMIENLTPDMMETMSQEFRLKLAQENAQNARQVLLSLSPDDLDKMTRWADRIQRGLDYLMKMKGCLLGKPGMVLALLVILLAILFHWLGYIGS
ncbi:hypothetical protein Vadar_027736 [Vaccinium darrowii]|uniref:Uncharacterized protein n=1 Tax=Vaccinium darrowii TaxID=229202 RepID=A0ACB7ZEE6_9ERIC|nr:hypothetical protein Vadar_027736 [Vaccinium darrowii]